MRKSMSRAIWVVVYAAAIVLFLAPRTWAQLQSGAVVGTVEDASGAVVPGAKITATNIGTGATGSATSSDTGAYQIPGLLPGTYRVTCQKEGFKLTTVEGVKIVVATATALKINLEVGTTVQTVEVTASVVPLNTVNPEVETAIEARVVMDLPLRVGQEGALVNTGRRQIETFTFIVPGAQGNTFDHRFSGGVSFSNEVLYDGVTQVTLDYPGFISLIGPAYESVDEFKVQTSVFSAQYGRGQAVENFHFASGTNALHGDVFEFNRQRAYDARPFFAPSRNIHRQDEYGFTVGGPVYIPKVYDGRNRTFFHFAYSRFKYLGSSQASFLTLPTDKFKQGNFEDLKDAAGNVIPIYDPMCDRGLATEHMCTAAEPRTQFPGNRIDSSLFSNVSKQLLPLIPSPTSSGNINNYLGGGQSLPITDNDFLYKIDRQISSGDRVSFVHSRTSKYQSRWVGSPIEGPLGTMGAEPVVGDTWFANYNHTFSPTVLNSFGTSFNLINQVQDWGNSNLYKNDKIEFPGLDWGPNVNYPGIGFSGPLAAPAFLGMGQWGLHTRFLGYAFSDNLVWTRGRHTLTMGGDFRRTHENNGQCTQCVGGFNFSNLTTSLPGSPDFLTAGHPFASFLLGIADYSSRTSANPWRGFRTGSVAGFVQDDIKVTRKLTLNLGLRWDQFYPLTEVYDRLAIFDPNLANPDAGGLPGAVTFAGTCSFCVGRHRYTDLHHKNFAPRFGFAYSLNNKTVLRGGYSIIYTNGGANYIFGPEVTDSFKTGYVASQIFNSPDGGITPGYGSWDNTYPAYVYPTLGPSVGNGLTVDYIGRDLGKSPYMQNWTLGVQREAPANILLTVSYVGNRGTRLASSLQNLNQVNPKWLSLGSELLADVSCLSDGTCPNAIAAGVQVPYAGFTGRINQALRPYPQYLGINSNNFAIDGYSTYHALQVAAQRRFSQGLQFLVSYTASKQIGTSAVGFTTFNGGAVNAFNRAAEKSIAPSDVPQMLSISGVYELPLGPGKPYAKRGGAAGKLLGGWQFGWVGSYRSGFPAGGEGAGGNGAFSSGITASNQLGLYGGGNRPNMVAGVDPSLDRSNFDPGDPNRNKIYNAAAFSQPPDFTIGNAPRFLSNLRGFPYYSEDISLIKRTPIHESINIEFRAEFFNVFNRVQFAGGDTFYSPANTNFGVVAGQANLPRLGQLSLKVNF